MTYRQEISLTGIIREALQGEGFRAVGFAPAIPHPEDTDHIRAWIAAGRHAGMTWMERSSSRRGDITTMVPGARSVIMAALPYRMEQEPPSADGYFVARFARVRDYHQVVSRKLKRVTAILEKEVPGSASKVFCDTSAVTEKEWAVRAGIGWRGKHSLIINEQLGSFFVLGGIVTTVALDYNESPAPDYNKSLAPDRCGSCRLCIDACPTGAICSDHPGDTIQTAADPRNRTIDARRCLSYLTIESKDEIPEWVGGKIGNMIFGCDRCQEVCPWNKVPAVSIDPELQPDPELMPDRDIGAITRNQWINMREEEFMSSFAESALRRAGLENIRNTIRFVERHWT